MIVKDDIAIEHIRDVRHNISAEFGHDPKRLVDHYVELPNQYTDRLERTTVPEPEPEKIVTP